MPWVFGHWMCFIPIANDGTLYHWDMFGATLVYMLNGGNAVFAKLAANVGTSWQCPVEDMRDAMECLKDKYPTST